MVVTIECMDPITYVTTLGHACSRLRGWNREEANTFKGAKALVRLVWKKGCATEQ